MSSATWVLASHNPGKAEEFRRLLAPAGIRLALPYVGGAAVVPETGTTYLENARIKSLAVARATGLPALGDDSGIEVDALDGRPGLHSADYVSQDPWTNVRAVLAELMAVPWPRRTARMRAVLVLASPDGTMLAAEGVVEGRIGFVPRGRFGFGYDPIFVLPDGRTLAELLPEEKDAVGHRGRAARALLEQWAAIGPSHPDADPARRG
jgi:XTP/dITP diphosphohydrolase